MTEKSSNPTEDDKTHFQPTALPVFAVQPLNITPIEIVAKRFPIAIGTEVAVNLQVNIIDIHVDTENFQAQLIIEVKVDPATDPHPFEIQCKIVGL